LLERVSWALAEKRVQRERFDRPQRCLSPPHDSSVVVAKGQFRQPAPWWEKAKAVGRQSPDVQSL